MHIKEITVTMQRQNTIRKVVRIVLNEERACQRAAILMSRDLQKLKYKKSRVWEHYNRRLGQKLKKAPSGTEAQKYRWLTACFSAGQMHIKGLYPFLLSVGCRPELESGDLLNLLVENTYSDGSIFILTAVRVLFITLLRRNTVRA